MQPDYGWQEDAIRKWFNTKPPCCGIVEAVTGTGKTFLGIGAIRKRTAATRSNGKHLYPVIVVPTVVLQQQWLERLADPSRGLGGRIGLLGAGRQDGFDKHDIIVAVVNSLARHGKQLLEFLQRSRLKSDALLVADECHRYIDAPVFKKILDLPFRYRLGLTPKVPSGSCIDFNVHGLGRIFYELDMKSARQKGLIPPFHLLNVPVPLTAPEAEKYDRLSQRVRTLRCQLEQELPSDALDYRGGIDIELLKRYLRTLRDDDSGRRKIQEFFAACFQRATIYYKAEAKTKALRSAMRVLAQYGGKVLVFFERIESADDAADLLELDGAALAVDTFGIDGRAFPWCRVLHSEVPMADRKTILREFGEPGNKVLIACRSLDEGFDIPEVDIAILAASTKSPRQRIQRIGRVLRRHSDTKRSIILTFFARGTGDVDVIVNDREMFPGPTDVYSCRETGWEDTLDKLLAHYSGGV